MAFTTEQLKRAIKTSLYGRRIGLDANDYIVGPPDIRNQIEDISSTVATTISAFGLTEILTSGSSQGPVQHNLPAPIPGVQKIIGLNTTSTASFQFLSTPNGASILTASDGTTSGVVNLKGPGGVVTLEGISTSKWMTVGVSWGTTTNQLVSFTTST